MLRLSKLRVADEIENGLAFYRYTFLTEIPKIYAALEESLRRDFALAPEARLPPFLRVGSWIGGDRDGNPNVVGGDTRPRDRRAGHGRVLVLSGAGPSTRRRAVAVGTTGHADPGTCWRWRRRRTTPIRIAVTNRIARHSSASIRALLRPRARWPGVVPPLAPQAQLAPYATPAELLADLATIRRFAVEPRRRAARCRQARPADSRHRGLRLPSRGARSATERGHSSEPWWRSFSPGPASPTTTRRCPRRRASRCWRANLPSAARCTHAHLEYSPRTASELGILKVAADIHRRYGAAALPNYVISKCQSVSDLLEVGVMLKEVGLLRGQDAGAQYHPAVRDHR